MSIVVPLTAGFFTLSTILLWIGRRRAVRTEFIRTYRYPVGLFEKLRKRRPELTLKDCQLVGNALRQFFLAHHKSERKYVSMPSQVADDLWHELILYTKNYEQFCHKAFGQFLHHVPAAALTSERRDNGGLRRTWWYCCKEENIDPKAPTRLPLLFALDAKLNIPDGFRYSLDCAALREEGKGDTYCVADIGCSSGGCGGGGIGCGGDGGGDGGGSCGGGGCGGGS